MWRPFLPPHLDAARAVGSHLFAGAAICVYDALAASFVAQGGPRLLEVRLRAAIGQPCAAEQLALRPLLVLLRFLAAFSSYSFSVRLVIYAGVPSHQ